VINSGTPQPPIRPSVLRAAEGYQQVLAHRACVRALMQAWQARDAS
jgi:hypothetical protein